MQLVQKNYLFELESLRAAVEVFILRLHFKLVLFLLEHRVPNNFTVPQLANRQKCINWLKEYREEGFFPNNPYFKERTSYFVGENGAFCAVGYLMHRSGHDNLVEQIQKGNNYVRIRDIKSGLALDWIAEYGLEKEEAALIQPTYGCGMMIMNCREVELIRSIILYGSPIAFLVLQWVNYMVVKRLPVSGGKKYLFWILGAFVGLMVGLSIGVISDWLSYPLGYANIGIVGLSTLLIFAFSVYLSEKPSLDKLEKLVFWLFMMFASISATAYIINFIKPFIISYTFR